MNIEEAIKNCEIYSKQIKQYDPDPFYVNHFFTKYIELVNEIVNLIFEEANRDFGLFISEKSTQDKFLDKAKSKKDQNAIKFSEWYSITFDQEHKNPFPNAMKKICEFKKKLKKIPEIKIMIRASDRYKDDVNQEIKVNLTNKKLRSKEELNIEIKRQLPIFLEIINHKRKKSNEPKVDENQITTSTFMDIEDHKDIEIAYVSEIYISVLKRMIIEVRKEIKKLTTWE
ncbi:MAG: hypothetical protein HOK63_05055 [Thaumarchaeota archaeon]|jgi:hypothetical protein|nr:hypothetical protein [Nitrososphaerota archaeon]MBT5842071.1 hypothetical protein [Nitrososphaerota archaeon]MBT6468999.1 hypothetical protein [Nitrososphaerota archaeon]